ncbi:MAG: tetratricopeptide repeat protein [Kiloniellales bacterium]
MPSRSSSRSAAFLIVLVTNLLCVVVAQARDPLWEELPWDERLGVSWFEQRGAQGDLAAQLRAAQMHEQGIGTPQDPAKAARWYARAAEQGHPLALFKTARAWQTGAIGTVDLARAARFYRAAADAGIGLASFNLAIMLETGEGLLANRQQAAALYEQAWRQGIAKAALSLGILRLTGSDSDPILAYAWIAAAADVNVPGAAAQRDRLAALLGSTAVSEAATLALPPLGDS